MSALLLLLLPLALAGGPDPAEVRAEAQRLLEEIEDQVAQGRWQAADDHFERLQALPGLELGYDALWQGYQVSLALGDANAQHQRLAAAARVQRTQQVLAAQARLLAWYGQVELSLEKKLDPRPPLTMVEVPMDPDQRRVYEAAAMSLAETGRYQGLLPLGQYQVGQTDFEILGELEPVVVKVKR